MTGLRTMFDLTEAPQGDVFAQFGEAQSPAHRGDRPARKHDADLSPLEKKLRERQRLSKSYLAQRKAHRTRLLEGEPRLNDFIHFLRSIGLEDGEELVSAIRESWLPGSDQGVRLFALELVTRRCNRLNRSVGLLPLDDELPEIMGGPPPGIWDRCRDLLSGGRA